jgi:hypothetical protein
MKKKQNPRTKSALLLTFCLLFCWATAGITADGIPLRKYPSPDGLVLDTIPKGQKFKSIETFGSWRYILVEGSTYGGGWVHFEDLEKEPATDPKGDTSSKLTKADVRKAPSPQKTDKSIKKPSLQSRDAAGSKNNPKPSFHSKVSLGTVKIHPVAVHKEPQKTEPDKRLKNNSDPNPKKDPPDHASKNSNKTAKVDLSAAQTAIEQSAQPTQNIKPTPHMPPQTEQTEPKEDLPTSEKNTPLTLIKTAHANALPTTTFSSKKVQNNPVQNPKIPGVMGKEPERSVAATHADSALDFSHKEKEKATHQGSMRDFLNFGFRFLSVVLSCLAIIFAYKAKRMAAMSYQLAVQLQQGIETHRRREFDERY